MVIEAVFVEHFGEAAVDAMAGTGQRLIDELGLVHPIVTVLYDSAGREMARFRLGTSDPTEESCDGIEAEMRSQNGASLRIVDANGVEAEVLLVIGSEVRQ